MRIDWNSATVVTDCDGIVGMKLNFDSCRVSGDGFVHRVVQHFGNKVMQGTFVGATDVHARTQANGFEPFKDFDRRRVIGIRGGSAQEIVSHSDSARFCWFYCDPV